MAQIQSFFGFKANLTHFSLFLFVVVVVVKTRRVEADLS